MVIIDISIIDLVVIVVVTGVIVVVIVTVIVVIGIVAEYDLFFPFCFFLLRRKEGAGGQNLASPLQRAPKRVPNIYVRTCMNCVQT